MNIFSYCSFSFVIFIKKMKKIENLSFFSNKGGKMKIYDSLEESFLHDKSISIDFSKAINNKEKEFLKFLFVEFSLDQDFNKKEILEIPLIKLQHSLGYNDLKPLKKFLDNLLSKKVLYSISDKRKIIFTGNFCIFSSYNILFDSVYLSMSKELILSTKEKNLYSLLNINLFVFMREISSYNLYRYLIANASNNPYIEISITSLKEILNSKEKYDRFFDFETKILKKVIDDINIFSNFEVGYVKVKAGEFKNNKVDKIQFTIKSHDSLKKQAILKEDVNKILNLIKDNITDFHSIQKLISKYIFKKGFDYVYKNALLVQNNPTDSFEQSFKKALLLDLSNEFSNKKFIEVINIHDIYSNTLFIQLILSAEMKRLELNTELQTLFDTRLFYRTSLLKDGHILEEDFGTFKLYVHYNRKTESIIRVSILKPIGHKDVADKK